MANKIKNPPTKKSNNPPAKKFAEKSKKLYSLNTKENLWLIIFATNEPDLILKF